MTMTRGLMSCLPGAGRYLRHLRMMMTSRFRRLLRDYRVIIRPCCRKIMSTLFVREELCLFIFDAERYVGVDLTAIKKKITVLTRPERFPCGNDNDCSPSLYNGGASCRQPFALTSDASVSGVSAVVFYSCLRRAPSKKTPHRL